MRVGAVVLFALSVAVCSGAAEEDEEEDFDRHSTLTYELEHALNDESDVFTPRGKLTVRLPRPDAHPPTPGKKRPAPQVSRPDPFKLSAEEAAAFAALVTRGGTYRVRLRPATAAAASAGGSGGGGADAYVMNSLRACELALAGMEEDMTLILDEEGHVAGLDYGTSRGHQGCVRGDGSKLVGSGAPELQLRTRADAVLPRIAAAVPMPKGRSPRAAAAVAPNSQAALAASGDPDAPAEEQPQPGFFRRYWYIIVPAMLFLLAGEPPAEEGGGGGGGGGGGAPPKRVHPSKRS